MQLFRSLAQAAALFVVLCASNTAKADTQPILEYNRLNRPSDTVGTIGSGLFGEQVDLYSGGTEFSATDISIPGNSALPVRLGRRLKVAEGDRYGSVASFANWENDVPYLSGYFTSAGWTVGDSASVNRCSVPVDQPAAARPPTVTETGIQVRPTDYWHGYQMYVPGAGTQEMLVNSSASPHPTDGNTYRWITKSNWTFRCLPALQAGGTGEGFLAISPDGTRYTFDRMVVMSGLLTSVKRPYTTSSGGTAYAHFARNKIVILATRIDDRFGNWVTFTYNTSNQLTQIAANDGRSIALTYNTNGHVATATNGTHTWTYQYIAAPGAGEPIYEMLSTVVQPDNSRWSYTYGGDLLLHDLSSEAPYYDCPIPLTDTIDGGSDYYDLTATHPSGATGIFHFLPLVRGRSYVDKHLGCTLAGWFYPKESLQFALYDKTLSGPGLPTDAWHYAYSPSNASFDTDCTTACATTIWTDVTNPDGTRVRRTFGNKFQATEGQLQETTVYNNVSNVLDDETTTYVADTTGQPFPANIGLSPDTRSNTFLSQTLHPVVTHAKVRDGVTFNSRVNTFDLYANPLSTTSYSSLGPTRTDITAYSHNTNLWVLGQLGSVQNSDTGVTIFNKTYDPATALLQSVTSYGLFDQSYLFWPDGNLKTVTDGNNHTVTLSNYTRGVPQLLQFPNSTSKSAVVDADGHVTALTDEMGYTSTFGYDAMGRLSSIAQPTGDSVAWTPTTISFAQIASAEYGLPAGHWKQTISTGNATKVNYFDGFWQPVLSQEYDAANIGGTQRFSSKAFDFAGRTTFGSYPLTTIAAYNSVVNGTRTTYDGLGRPTASTQDSELGALTTSYAYLTGFQTRVTNPRNYATTTSYQVFDSPDTSRPISIASPANASTTITRDVFGKPLTLTRSDTALGISTTRSYVYDANQRLCKRVEPESGATLMDYDGANNIAWTVTGSALTSLTCDRASVAAASKTVRSYDTLNRPLTVDVPNSSNDLAYGYFNDGALQTLTSGASTWTYTYNKRRLPVTEQLSIDARLSTITHGYNPLGQESSLTYPSGLVVATTPNALGQPSTAGTYATGISYFANGGMSGFTYGNGAVHSLTQNARFLPLRSKDVKGAASILDDTYAYDANANVLSITDGVVGGSGNRSMAYDGLDRLNSTGAPYTWWINASTTYDALDNIRSNTLGNRVYNYAYDATSKRLSQLTRPDNSVAYTLGYDAFGNVTSKGAGQDSYVFDAANRMTSVTTKESYQYDGYGRRVKVTRISDSKLDYPIYTMGGQLLTEDDQRSNKSIDYISLNGSLVAKRSAPIGTSTWTTNYEHTDALHSPIAETDSAGNVSGGKRFTPYGEPGDQIYAQGLGFTGHMADGATGLTYAQQRYYDPVIGRFLSTDPVQASDNGASFNRYNYANNNPYRFTDPDGREAGGGYATGLYTMSGPSVSSPETANYALAAMATIYGGPIIEEAVGSIAGLARGIAAARSIERVASVVEDAKGISGLPKAINAAKLSQKEALSAVEKVVSGQKKAMAVVDGAEKSKVALGTGQLGTTNGTTALRGISVAADGTATSGTATVQVSKAGADLAFKLIKFDPAK